MRVGEDADGRDEPSLVAHASRIHGDRLFAVISNYF